MDMQAFSMLKKALTAICATFVLVSTNVQAQGELKGETLTIYLDISAPPMSYVSEDMRYPDGVETEIIYPVNTQMVFNVLKKLVALCIKRADSLKDLIELFARR